MIKVVLIEDHEAMREGIELLLAREGCDVLGAAGDAPAGDDLVERTHPDVALIDIGLPGGSGIELTRRLLRRHPDLGVVLYTGHDDARLVSRGLDSGARGYALKGGSPSELMEAIRTIAAGGTYFDPRLGPVLRVARTPARRGHLTEREREIVQLLATGLTGEEIAERLELSPETVRTHVRNAMRRLGARTRAHAIALAVRRGDVELELEPEHPEAGAPR